MIVALSILFAALVGGVVFMLLDNWQRRSPQAPAPQPEPAWPPPRPEARTQPLPPRQVQEPQGSLWSGWARR
jgi:hypothetical protein